MTSLGQLLSLITNEHILNTIPGYLRQKEREENPEVWQRVTAENRGRFADSCSLWHSVVLHCLTGVGEHFPPRLVLVHCPTGLSHFITHHIANHTSRGVLPMLSEIPMLEGMCREPSQTFCIHEGCC